MPESNTCNNRKSVSFNVGAVFGSPQGGTFTESVGVAVLDESLHTPRPILGALPKANRPASPPLVEIIIPVFNQLACTIMCLESLRRNSNRAVGIVIVDNGSSDGTAEYLASCDDLTVISNPQNRGCAAAWNQGVRACLAEWIVVLNNDTVLPAGWLDGLLTAAEMENLDIVTPAIREGLLNYDLEPYAREFVKTACGAMRPGVADGICFMVRRRVFDAIGLFDENFRIGVFEDTDFFERARRAGFKLGMTGRSFIHHFGSVTQKCIRQAKTCGPYEEENRRYFNRKWRLNQVKRWIRRFKRKRRTARWSALERRQYGHSLYERWRGERLVHC